MTCKEARRILMSDADFSGVGEKSEQTADALCAAIDALEKQIPKKPFVRYPQYKDWIYCPCGEYVCNIGQEIKPNYCKHCGQALDWSDVK